MNRNEGATGTSGYQPGRPHSSKKEPLKFDADYDFEQANEQFQEFLTKFEVSFSTSQQNEWIDAFLNLFLRH